MIQLEDFIAETLKQIINGVKSAQDYAKENGAVINSTEQNFRTDQGVVKVWDRVTGVPVQDICFDISIVTSEEYSANAGFGLFVGAIGTGLKGKAKSQNNSENRIKFEIPVGLPHQIPNSEK